MKNHYISLQILTVKTKMHGLVLTLLWMLIAAGQTAPVKAVLPQPPVQCTATGCTVWNTYMAWGSDRRLCRASSAEFPNTEEELVAAVSKAARLGLKVKAVSGFSHSMQRMVCPGDGNNEENMVISTRDYRGVEVNAEEMTLTAESGAELRAVVDAAAEAGLSLVASPYWEGLSVGGMLGSGAHGSSWWGRGGSVHDHVVGLSLVVPASASEGFAKVVWLDDSPSSQHLFNAAKVSLGLLGVISKVMFKLEKGFKRSITLDFTDEKGIEDKFIDLAKRHEFADITWYPSEHKAVYRYDDRVPLDTPGDGSYDFFGFSPTPILITETARASEKTHEDIRISSGKCALSSATFATKKLLANGLKNNGVAFTGYPVIGPQARMQTSGSCHRSLSPLDACPWDPRTEGLVYFETSAFFAAADFKPFLRDIMALRALRPDAFCGIDLYIGFLIRFVRASDAYLGQDVDSVAIEFTYYRANAVEGLTTPRLNQDIWEEVEQIAFFKYKAKPHWGKNRDVAFFGAVEKYPNLGRFLEAKRELDPIGLFSSEWSDELGFGDLSTSSRRSRFSDGCAMEGQCLCSEDIHCSPENGYFCKKGLVYEKARVCRYIGLSL